MAGYEQSQPQGPMQPQMPGMGTPPPDMPMEAPPPQEPQQDFQIEALLREVNIAKKLSQEKREEIGIAVKKGYETDLSSRSDWEQKLDEWSKLALQVRETKSYPWPGASNVKYPILSTAAMQFAARAYPALVPANGNIVNYRVIGEDKGGMKAAKAKRVSQYMSWQLLEQMTDWEEDMDRMMIMLPIVGCAFKKTFWSEKFGRNCSNLVHPKDLVVNYWADSLDKCERKTQLYYYSKRELLEKFRAGEFLEVDLPDPAADNLRKEDKALGLVAGEVDESTPYLVLEQHNFIDLDGDGYPEPYITTALYQDATLLRISARWDSDGVKKDEKGKIVCIHPVEYYTKFPFIPNPDGGFYDIGFGLLLGPINESVNTIINQLIDSGHMATLGGGWISKGLRIKQGAHKFSPNEWKQVDATLDDIKKGIFPLPVKEPSNVLFQLLGSLITSSKELASVAEIFTGKMPGQNTPAYTTKETVEQGMKVFTAIYKRCYRAFSQELKKLYRLNQIYFDAQKVGSVTESPMSAQDFNGPSDDIVPAADPSATSMTDKMQKVQMLGQMIQLGLDKNEVVKRILEAMEVPNYQELFSKQPPPPPPEVQKLQMEQKMKQEELQAKMKMEQEEHQMEMEKIKMELEALRTELQMKFEFEKMKLQLEMQKLGIKMKEGQIDAQLQLQQAQIDQATGQQDMNMQQQQHDQKMEQGAATHNAKMKQNRQTLTLKKDKPKDGTSK